MKKSNLAYLIDDNNTALKLATGFLQRTIPELKIVPLIKSELLVEELNKSEEIPNVIFTDLNMPGMNGVELIRWVKRHPKFHQVPIIVLSAENDPEEVNVVKKQGATGYCLKPLQAEDIKREFKIVQEKNEEASLSTELESGFAQECLEIAETFENFLQTELQESSLKEIYRLFHTIKGVAATLEYPHLAIFMHQAESFLNYVKQQQQLFKSPQVVEILKQVCQYIKTQAHQLTERQLMDLPLETLLSSMNEIILNGVKDVGEDKIAEKSNVVSITSSTAVASAAISKSESLRVKYKDLDAIQASLKKILQTKVQLNLIARQLNEEFFDEAFPKEIVAIIKKLETESLAAMEGLINLRVVSVATLAPYCEKLLKELCTQLGKKCKLKFELVDNVDIDLSILELLKNAFTHMIRNSMDHGIEIPSERLEKNKPEEAVLTISCMKLPDKKFQVVLKDDGRGINQEKLKQVMIKKGIFSEAQIEKFTPHQIMQLIFVDGLSTKDEVTEISGRGLGMSAVKEEIEKIEGSIVADSEIGQGTTNTMILPLYFIL